MNMFLKRAGCYLAIYCCIRLWSLMIGPRPYLWWYAVLDCVAIGGLVLIAWSGRRECRR